MTRFWQIYGSIQLHLNARLRSIHGSLKIRLPLAGREPVVIDQIRAKLVDQRTEHHAAVKVLGEIGCVGILVVGRVQVHPAQQRILAERAENWFWFPVKRVGEKQWKHMCEGGVFRDGGGVILFETREEILETKEA